MRMFLVVLAGLLLLTACDDKPEPTPDDPKAEHPASSSPTGPLNTQPHQLTRTPEDCQGERCPQVSLSWISIDQHPALNDAIKTAVAEMIASDTATSDNSLSALADAFLADAGDIPMSQQQGWQLSASARLQGRHGPLITLALESYEYTGGAHGLPAVAYLHWHDGKKKSLSLADLLVEGQQDAFWDAARQQHQQWLANQDLDQTFRDSWPFQRTDQAYLNENGLVLHYNVYDIAPYAMGQPTLTLPYDQLEGLLKPVFLP